MFIDHVMLRAWEAGSPFREASSTLRPCSGEGLDLGGAHHLSGVKSLNDCNVIHTASHFKTKIS